jgi:O-antigen ligase
MLIFNAIGILIALVTLINYSLGFTLAIAARVLIPGSVRFYLGPLDISLNTFLTFILVVRLVIISLIRIFVKEKYKWDNTFYPKQYVLYFILFIVSSFVIIPFGSIVPFEMQINANMQFTITELATGIIAWFAIQDIKQLKLLCKFIFGSLIIGCIYGIYVYFVKIDFYAIFIHVLYETEIDFAESFLNEERGILNGRICGTTNHPLAWGQILVLILSFITLCKSHKVKLLTNNKIIYFLFFSLITVNIFLTGSRSSILSFIFFLFFLFLSFNLKDKLKTIIYLFGCFVFISLISLQNTELDSFFTNFAISDNNDIRGSSVSMRSEQLSTAFDLIKDNPLFGLGYGLVENRNKVYFPISNLSTLLGFESVLFSKLVQQGLFGLFFFFLFYFHVYSLIRHKYEKYLSSDIFIINGFFISYFVSIIVTGIQSTFWLFFLLSTLQLKYCYILKYNGENHKKYKSEK